MILQPYLTQKFGKCNEIDIFAIYFFKIVPMTWLISMCWQYPIGNSIRKVVRLVCEDILRIAASFL